MMDVLKARMESLTTEEQCMREDGERTAQRADPRKQGEAASDQTTDRISALATELLELILLGVDMSTVFSSQRVSKKFRSTIQGSKALQRHMWLQTPFDHDVPFMKRVCYTNDHTMSCFCAEDPAGCRIVEEPYTRLNPMLHRLLAGFAYEPHCKCGQKPCLRHKIKSHSSEVPLLKSFSEYHDHSYSHDPIEVPIFDIHILLWTVKSIKNVMQQADNCNQKWLDMHIFSPNPFDGRSGNRELTVGYTAYEKLFSPGKKPSAGEGGMRKQTSDVDDSDWYTSWYTRNIKVWMGRYRERFAATRAGELEAQAAWECSDAREMWRRAHRGQVAVNIDGVLSARIERKHWINAGSFPDGVTMRTVCESVVARNRDIYEEI